MALDSPSSSSSSPPSPSFLIIDEKQVSVERLDPSMQKPSKEQSGLLVLSALLSLPSYILRDPKKAAIYETLFNQQDLYLVALTVWEATKKHDDLEKDPVFFGFSEGGSLGSDICDAYHRIVSEEDAAKLHDIDSQVDGCMFMSRHIDDRVFVIRVLFGHPQYPILFEYHGLHPTAKCITREPGRTIEFPSDMMMHVSDSPRYFSELYALHAALLADSGCDRSREHGQPAAKKFWTGARVTFITGNLGVASGAKKKFCSFGNIVSAVEVPLKEDQHIASIDLIREDYLTGQPATVSADGSGSKNRSASRRKAVPPPAPSSSQILASSDYLNVPVKPALFVGYDYLVSDDSGSESEDDGDDDNDEDWGGLGKKRRKPSRRDDDDDDDASGASDGDEDDSCKEPPAKRPCPAKSRSTVAVIDLTYTAPEPDPDEEDLLRSPFVREAAGREMDVEPLASPLIGLPVNSALLFGQTSHSEPVITMSQFRQAMDEMKAEFDSRMLSLRREMEEKLQQQQAPPAPAGLDAATKTLLDNFSTKLADALDRIGDLEVANDEGDFDHECNTEELEEEMNEKIKSVKQLTKGLRKEFDLLKVELNDSIRGLETRLDSVASAASGAGADTEQDEDSGSAVTQHGEQLQELTKQMARIQASIVTLTTQYQALEIQTLTYNTNLTSFQKTSDGQVSQITDMDGRIKKITEALRQLKPLVEGVDRRLKEMQPERGSLVDSTTPVTMEISVPGPVAPTAKEVPEPIAAGPAPITA